MEIACDESGYEGEKLVGGTTDVFAHASVRLDADRATDCIRELRERIRSPATEYKANHLLRQKHRSALTWLLGPMGPLRGTAHVYLIDKAFFVVRAVVDLLVEEVARDDAMAATLYREGRHAFDREQWQALLEASNNLMRATERLDSTASVDSFFRMVDVLRLADAPVRVQRILELLARTRARVDSFRARILDDPTMVPTLDPLIPAIVQAVVHWSDGEQPVTIIHDRQNTLSVERIAQLKEIFTKPAHARHSPSGQLTSLNLVDSRSDARIQLADILAGTARKIASEELNDRGDAEPRRYCGHTWIRPRSGRTNEAGRCWAPLDRT